MIQDWLLAIINSYHSEDYFKFGSIPPAKLAIALQHYPVDPSDTPLALVDATLFGSAKNGMVIGEKGIYWHNDRSVYTARNFLSWEELAGSPNPISKTTFEIEMMPGCRFGMSGCRMSKGTLISLLDRIIDLHQRTPDQDMQPEQEKRLEPNNSGVSSNVHSSGVDIDSLTSYVDVVPKLLAVFLAADDKTDDSQVELAEAIIESDDLILDKQSSLESLLQNLDKLAADKKKSKTIFRLRCNTIFAKVATVKSKLQKARLSVIVEGMSESAERDAGTSVEAPIILETLRNILAAVDKE